MILQMSWLRATNLSMNHVQCFQLSNDDESPHSDNDHGSQYDSAVMNMLCCIMTQWKCTLMLNTLWYRVYNNQCFTWTHRPAWWWFSELRDSGLFWKTLLSIFPVLIGYIPPRLSLSAGFTWMGRAIWNQRTRGINDPDLYLILKNV